MKRGTLLAFLMGLAMSAPLMAQTTIGMWNFDDGTAGMGFYSHGVSKGFTAREGALDLSGNGYHMKGWSDTAGPKFSVAGKSATGYGLSSQYSGGQDGYCDYASMVAWSPSQWTIEFSFNMPTIQNFKTLIGRDAKAGYPADSKVAPLYIQIGGSGQVKIQFVSVSDELISCDSTLKPVANKWYHVVMRCDGTNVDFFVDNLDGTGFQSAGTKVLTDCGAIAGNNHSMKAVGNWVFGRGNYNGAAADKMTGFIDDIRLTDGALQQSAFLQSAPAIVNPAPTLGQTMVAVDSELSWDLRNSLAVDHYEVFLSSDPNDLEPNIFENAKLKGKYVTTTTDSVPFSAFNAIAPNYVKNEKTYKWRVDAYLTATGTPVKSGIGYFTTAPSQVVIITEPADALANRTAELSVTASSAARYAWYKVGTATALADTAYMTGTNTSKLKFDFTSASDSVAASYEGRYYCVMKNGATDAATNSTATTRNALLFTARLVGYWNFNDNLSDSVALEVAGVAAHNGVITSSGSANAGDLALSYAEGVGYDANTNSGDKAVQFTDDSDIVTMPITSGEDVFNYYPLGFTYSMWYKFNGPSNPGWRLPMSKLDAGSSGWLIGLDHSARNAGVFILENTGLWVIGNNSIVMGDGQWHLLTTTYNPANDALIIYNDGVASATSTIDLSAMTVPVAPLSIGGRNTENSIYGLIDEVKVYSYPRTQTQIADELYAFTGRGVCMVNYASQFDFNTDCKIDINDMAKFAQSWLDCGKYPAGSCN